MARLKQENDKEVEQGWCLPFSENVNSAGIEPSKHFWNGETEKESPHPDHPCFFLIFNCIWLMGRQYSGVTFPFCTTERNMSMFITINTKLTVINTEFNLRCHEEDGTLRYDAK